MIGSSGLSGGKSRYRPWMGVLAVAGLAAGLFAGTLSNPLIGDDVIVVRHYSHAYSPSWIPQYFTAASDMVFPPRLKEKLNPGSTRVAMYRPLLLTSLAIDHNLWGENATGWRLTNLLLHVAVCVLVLLLSRRLFKSEAKALVAAVVFAAHPVHTEAVNTLLGGRSGLLAALFVLSAWLLHLRAEQSTGRRLWAGETLSALVLLLGLLSKENAVVMPPLAVLFDVALRGNKLRRTLLRISPHLVVLALYAVVHLYVSGRVAPAGRDLLFGNLGGFRITLALLALQALYLRLALVPWPLRWQVCYERFPWDCPVWLQAVAAATFAGLLALSLYFVLKKFRRGTVPFWAVGCVAFYLCLVPVSHVVPHLVLFAERFLYLPSVAVCLAVGEAAGWLKEKFSSRVATTAVAFLVAILSTATLVRNHDWADAERFWLEVAECAPGDFRPYDSIGNSLLLQGKPQKAVHYFRKALEIAKENAISHYNLALALQRIGDVAGAKQHYRKALEIEPRHAMAASNLGAILLQQGKLREAEELFRRAILFDPTHPAAYVNLGNLRQLQSDQASAEKLYRAALQVAPDSLEARFNLARLLARTGRKAEAGKLYREIIASNPNHAMAHNNLANLLKDSNEFKEAEMHYLAALRADPDCAPAHYNFGGLLLATGRYAEAQHHFEQAIRLNPRKIEARIGLARALRAQGKHAEARRVIDDALKIAPRDPRLLHLLGR